MKINFEKKFYKIKKICKKTNFYILLDVKILFDIWVTGEKAGSSIKEELGVLLNELDEFETIETGENIGSSVCKFVSGWDIVLIEEI